MSHSGDIISHSCHILSYFCHIFVTFSSHNVTLHVYWVCCVFLSGYNMLEIFGSFLVLSSNLLCFMMKARKGQNCLTELPSTEEKEKSEEPLYKIKTHPQ